MLFMAFHLLRGVVSVWVSALLVETPITNPQKFVNVLKNGYGKI